MSKNFTEVREWIKGLSESEKFYQIEWKTVNHRILGTNRIPTAVRIESLDDALGITGKRKQADEFQRIVSLTEERLPRILSWIAKRPLRALELAEDFSRLLDVVEWIKNNPRSSVYLRQIDLPGIHTKFIETHRGVLTEMLNLVLPESALNEKEKGISGFSRRYGFLDKPLRVRFRILDPDIRLLPAGSDQDITVTEETFSGLDIPVSRVFITENEINYLAFPDFSCSMVIFGAGYGFANLVSAEWLYEKKIYYWGDIDTHGFAILNQLRRIFPHVKSFLMDLQTLLAHKALWGTEIKQDKADLAYLTGSENELYNQLRHNSPGERIRLEQERIGFNYLLDVLRKL